MLTLLEIYQTLKEVKDIAEAALIAKDLPDFVNQIRGLDPEAIFLHSLDEILKQEQEIFLRKKINFDYNLDVLKMKLRKHGVNFERFAASPKILNEQIGKQVKSWILANDFLIGVDIDVEVNSSWAERIVEETNEKYAKSLHERLFSSAVRQDLQYISNNVKDNPKIQDGISQLLDLSQNILEQLTTKHTSLNPKVAQELFGVAAYLVEFDKIRPATQERVKAFYEGERLWWDIIVANGDVERDLQRSVIENYSSYPENLKILCFAGEPGAGKSTLAWRVAEKISSTLALPLVQARNNESDEFWYLLENGINQYGKPIVVLVDDIFRDANAIKALSSINPDSTAIIISTSRSNEVPEDLLLHFEINFIYLQSPTTSEKNKALHKTKLQSNLNSEQLNRLSKATSWLVLMYEMTTGKKLARHIRDSVDRLEEQDIVVYNAYEYICFAGQYDIEIPLSLFERIDHNGRFFEIYNRSTARGLILKSNSSTGFLRAKHSIIAKFASDRYKRDPRIVAKEICAPLNYIDYKERSFLIQFLLSLMKHKLVNVAKEILTTIDVDKINAYSFCRELILGWNKVYEMLGESEKALAAKMIACSKPIKTVADWEVMIQEYTASPSYVPDFLQKVIDWIETTSSKPIVWVSSIKAIEKSGTFLQIEEAIHSTEQWLKDNPQDSYVRTFHLGLLERRGTPEQIKEAISSTSQWLKENPNESHLRTFYLVLVEQEGTATQIEEAILSTEHWLKDNPKDLYVRMFCLGLIERKGTSKQVDEAIRNTTQWLKDNPQDSQVRKTYWELLERIGNPEQIEEAISGTAQWLKDNPQDAHVRRIYWKLLKRKGTPEQIEEAISGTAQWLKDNPQDAYVRTFYLGLLERQGTLEQIEEAISSTVQWLKDNPQDDGIRTIYLGLLEQKGTPEQIEEAISGTAQWLKDNPQDAYVRTFYLGLLKREGTPEQIEEAVSSTAQWLKDNLQDAGVRTVYLGLLEQKGTPEQIEEAINSTTHWLDGNLKESYIRSFYLGLLERQGMHEQIEEAINNAAHWLKDNPRNVEVRKVYLGLLERQGTSEQIEEAISSTTQWLKDNPRNVEVRRAYLGLLEKKGTPEQVEEAISSTAQWLKDKPRDVEVRKAYMGLLEREGTVAQIEEAILNTEHWSKDNPNSVEVRRVYLGLLERKGNSKQIEEAIFSTEQWLKNVTLKKGSKAGFLYKIGLLMLKVNQLDDAEKYFRDALMNHQGFVAARIRFAWCLYKQGKKKAALRELKRSLKWSQRTDFPVSEAYFQIGSYWYQEHDYSNAETFFRKAIQFCDKRYYFYKYYTELGRTLLILKDFNALTVLQKAKEYISEAQVDESIEIELDELLTQAYQLSLR